MELRHTDHLGPIGDPFFDVVRRRHPDVDIVLLPPEQPASPADPVDESVAGAAVADAVARVALVAEQLWAAVAPESDEVPAPRLGYADRLGEVRATARVLSRLTDGYQVLVTLRHELEQGGWAVSRPPGAVERLVGRLDDVRVQASYADEAGTFLLDVSTDPMTVGPDRSRALVQRSKGDQ
ncbi:MAG: hypothetical protein WKF50_08210 [Nocardioides sp.]